MVTLQVYKCNKMNAYVLLLLSNSKEIKQETENKHWGLSEVMVSLVLQRAAFLGGAVHHWCGAGTQSAVTLGRFSHWCERAGPAAMHRNQMNSTRHKATSNLTLVSNDLKRTRSHLAQTALENKSIALAKETSSINDKRILFLLLMGDSINTSFLASAQLQHYFGW